MKSVSLRDSSLSTLSVPRIPELECPACLQTFSSQRFRPDARRIISCPNCGLAGEEQAFVPQLELQKTLALARSKMELACARMRKRG